MTTISPRIASYDNGSYHVDLYSDGTKERIAINSTGVIQFPESIDVKITDFCDMGCQWCHESSTTKGQHGDLDFLLDQLMVLPSGIELAIGGGNPLAHPQLKMVLHKVKSLGYIANLTVNHGHLLRFRNYLHRLIENDLIKGLGISIQPKLITEYAFFVKALQELTPHVVFHVIAGVHDFNVVKQLEVFDYRKILILGYKTYGFGSDYYSPAIAESITKWKQQIHTVFGNATLCFDNLAIDQLAIRRFFTDAEWAKFYMGDDFTHSMYADAVKQEWAPTSRSSDRISMHQSSLLQFFSTNSKQQRLAVLDELAREAQELDMGY